MGEYTLHKVIVKLAFLLIFLANVSFASKFLDDNPQVMLGPNGFVDQKLYVFSLSETEECKNGKRIPNRKAIENFLLSKRIIKSTEDLEASTKEGGFGKVYFTKDLAIKIAFPHTNSEDVTARYIKLIRKHKEKPMQGFNFIFPFYAYKIDYGRFYYNAPEYYIYIAPRVNQIVSFFGVLTSTLKSADEHHMDQKIIRDLGIRIGQQDAHSCRVNPGRGEISSDASTDLHAGNILIAKTDCEIYQFAQVDLSRIIRADEQVFARPVGNDLIYFIARTLCHWFKQPDSHIKFHVNISRFLRHLCSGYLVSFASLDKNKFSFRKLPKIICSAAHIETCSKGVNIWFSNKTGKNPAAETQSQALKKYVMKVLPEEFAKVFDPYKIKMKTRNFGLFKVCLNDSAKIPSDEAMCETFEKFDASETIENKHSRTFIGQEKVYKVFHPHENQDGVISHLMALKASIDRFEEANIRFVPTSAIYRQPGNQTFFIQEMPRIKSTITLRMVLEKENMNILNAFGKCLGQLQLRHMVFQHLASPPKWVTVSHGNLKADNIVVTETEDVTLFHLLGNHKFIPQMSAFARGVSYDPVMFMALLAKANDYIRLMKSFFTGYFSAFPQGDKRTKYVREIFMQDGFGWTEYQGRKLNNVELLYTAAAQQVFPAILDVEDTTPQ